MDECDTDKILVARPLPRNDAIDGTPMPSAHRKQSAINEQIERKADARMLQEPPQPEPEPEEEPSNTLSDYSDGFGLFQINELTNFIETLTRHSAQCSGVFVLDPINFRMGSGIEQTWRCSCNKKFTHIDNN